jgi:hypothetical protein
VGVLRHAQPAARVKAVKLQQLASISPDRGRAVCNHGQPEGFLGCGNPRSRPATLHPPTGDVGGRMRTMPSPDAQHAETGCAVGQVAAVPWDRPGPAGAATRCATCADRVRDVGPGLGTLACCVGSAVWPRMAAQVLFDDHFRRPGLDLALWAP